MKITLLSILIISFFAWVSNATEMMIDCPEIKGIDWAYLNTYLTSPLYDDLHEILEISIMKTNVDELETKDFEGLKKYLEAKGISSVTEDETCNKIKLKLDSDGTLIQSTDEYRRIFFKVNNFYLVLYPKIKLDGIDSEWPINVLNSNFEIVASYYTSKE